MTRSSSIAEHWPSPRERLLLRAALLDGHAALEAWSRWKEALGGTPEPSVSAPALRPLLYRNLFRLGVEDPLAASWEPAYRRTLYRNQLMLQEAAPLIRSLEDAGIETLLLKGTALILRYYEDAGLRPMADLDVMVRRDQLPLACERLATQSWVSPQQPDPTTLAAAHSAPFNRPGASPLDLHWRLLEDEAPAPGDQALWARAAPVELFGVPTRALGATDQLLHVLAHGSRWSADRSHRWLADASVLLSRAQGEIHSGAARSRGAAAARKPGAAAGPRLLEDVPGRPRAPGSARPPVRRTSGSPRAVGAPGQDAISRA